MYCGKCGKEIDQSVKFCPYCGAENPNAVRTVPVQTGAAAEAQPAGGKSVSHRTVGIAAAAVIAVAALVLIFSLMGGRSVNSTADKYVSAVTEPNSAQLFDLLPKGLGVKNEAETAASLDAQLENAFELIEQYLGAPVKYSCRVVSQEEVSESRLESIKNKYQDKYGITVKEALTAEVELTAAGKQHTETVTFSLPMVKVGGSWAMDYVTMGSGFDLSFLYDLF